MKSRTHEQTSKHGVKDQTYSGSGKREFDRSSGTGAAHNKANKKSGGGKGNWGKDDGTDETPKLGEDGKPIAKEEAQPEEEPEPVLTLNDYMAENNLKLVNIKSFFF